MTKVKIILRKIELAKGGYPICIRVAMKGYSTSYIRIEGLQCESEEWNKEFSRFRKNKKDAKELNESLSSIENRIDTITSRLLSSNKFTISAFKRAYNTPTNTPNNCVIGAFKHRIKQLEALLKEGTAAYYTYAMNAFTSYAGTSTTFEELDYKFLQGYKQQRLENGNSTNTLAMYFRAVKALHNEYAKLNGLQPPTVYRQLKIKTEKTRSRALDAAQLKSLLNYTPSTIYEKRSLDLFAFSLYGRGISIIDIAMLTHSNIVNSRIEYFRSKTNTFFSIPITKEMQVIIDRWKGDKYLFPIIQEKKSKRIEVRNFNKTHNNILKRISLSIGLPPITGYFARHSFSTLMRSNGLNIDVISSLLGHSSTRVTAIYLKSFSDNTLDDACNINLE